MKPWDLADWPNARNSSSSSSPQHAISGGWEYAAVVQHNWKLVIYKRAVGADTWAASFNFPDNGFSQFLVQVNDSHNCIAIAVDSLGYIHIVGNSHDFASEGLRYLRSTNPHDISDWTAPAAPAGWAEGSPNGHVVATYFTFQMFSDGEVSLAASMSEQFSNPSVGGRDWGLWKIPVGTNTLTPVRGGILAEIMVADGGAANSDSIPDRSYMYGHHIDVNDVLHLSGVWRVETSDPNSMLEAFYVRSLDRGVTWENVMGETVLAPFTYRATLDGMTGSASAAIKVGDNPVSCKVFGSMASDVNGNPYLTLTPVSGVNLLVYHNGSEWLTWEFTSPINMQIDSTPVVARVGIRIWVFGCDIKLSLGTDKGKFYGVPWSEDVDSWLVDMGLVSRYTPDGVYTFEDRTTFAPTPIWAGGNVGGVPVARFMIPDGDTPMIRSVGEHRRSVPL